MPTKRRRGREFNDRTLRRSLEKQKSVISKPLTSEFVDAHFGFMKTNGRLLKALVEEKKREREL